MSDGAVRAAIEQMEAWIADPLWEPDPEALAQWNAEFQAAIRTTEKADGWPDLVARAHALGPKLELHTLSLSLLRDEVRAELNSQERGNRALRGYRTSTH